MYIFVIINVFYKCLYFSVFAIVKYILIFNCVLLFLLYLLGFFLLGVSIRLAIVTLLLIKVLFQKLVYFCN